MGFDWEYILGSENVEEAYQELLDTASDMLGEEPLYPQVAAVQPETGKEVTQEIAKADACAPECTGENDRKRRYDDNSEDEDLPFGND